MRMLSIALRILVGLVFTGQAVMKLTGVQNEWRDDLQVAPWFWVLTGIIQLVGALGLFASLRVERLAIPSGLLFVGVMLGALATHIRAGDPVSALIFPAILLLLAAGIVATGWQLAGESVARDSGRQRDASIGKEVGSWSN